MSGEVIRATLSLRIFHIIIQVSALGLYQRAVVLFGNKGDIDDAVLSVGYLLFYLAIKQ